MTKTAPKITPTEPRYPYVHVDVPLAEVDRVSSALFDAGAQGIEERDATTLDKARGAGATLVASFDDDKTAKRVAKLFGKRFEARVEYVVGDAWRDAWRAYFKPTRLGKRLVIRPSWEEVEAKKRDVVLTLDPGRAFGSGTHASTRLVLAELDKRVRGEEAVLDVGCGSGILAVAALLLGSSRAVAIDVDADAVEVTRENAALNRVASRVRASTTPLEKVRGTYDLVLANIEAPVHLVLAESLVKRVAPGGILILSGILIGQEEAVLDAYAPLKCVARPTEGEWIALVLKRGAR